MKKLVNGKVIDIRNIELFELAAEGLARQNSTASKTNDGIKVSVNSAALNRYIKQYDIFFNAMPYPLYAIEADIKYATLGNFIKSINKNSNILMWIDNGLNIQLDSHSLMTLHIVNNTWSIEYKKPSEDNTDMNRFREVIGYEEYIWLLTKVLNREMTDSAAYYKKFMPEFIEACNGNNIVIKWELDNILNFGSVPKRIELVDNKITDATMCCEYTLDTYVTGTVDTDEKVTTFDLTRASGARASTLTKQMKVYGYDVYVKSIGDPKREAGYNTSDRLTKTTVPGIQSLFFTLTGIKSAQERKTFPVFKGLIIDTNLVYTVNGSLYVTKSNRLVESKEIARGVEIWGIDRNNVYFLKSKRITDAITRDTIYSYNLADHSIRLCSIRFRY